MSETVTGWIEHTEIVETTTRHLPEPEPGKGFSTLVMMLTYIACFGLLPILLVNLVGGLAFSLGAPDWVLVVGLFLYIFGAPLAMVFAMWKNQALAERVTGWPLGLSKRIAVWACYPLMLLMCLIGLKPWAMRKRFCRQRQRISTELHLDQQGSETELRWQPVIGGVEIIEETEIDTAPTKAPEPTSSGQLALKEGQLAFELFRTSGEPGTPALEIRQTHTGERIAISLDPSLISETEQTRLPRLDRPVLTLSAPQLQALLAQILPIAEAQGAHIPRALKALQPQTVTVPETVAAH